MYVVTAGLYNDQTLSVWGVWDTHEEALSHAAELRQNDLLSGVRIHLWNGTSSKLMDAWWLPIDGWEQDPGFLPQETFVPRRS